MPIPTLIESRCGLRPIPQNFTDYLSLEQKMALFGLSRLGWRLKFIRRSYHQEPTVVLRSRRNNRVIGVLERNGRINAAPTLMLRR